MEVEYMANELFGGGSDSELKLFIGAAPGVGKTYTMLAEANRLRERGVDVVIGYIDTHGRPETQEQIGPLEMIPRRVIHYRGRRFEEVDLEAICARKPDVVVIDELAHSNAPGSTFPKRYMDVEYLLDQGISVLTAVNVQHIEGIHEEAQEITGIRVQELIPAAFVKRAQEVEVIDVTPETLRQRMRDGSIYPPDKIHQALEHFFRKSNLFGLRELALRLVAEDVDERLQRSYARSRIPGPVGARESIMVCVNYLPRAVQLIQRGYRMAQRMKAELYVLSVFNTGEGQLKGREKERLDKLQQIALDCGAEWILEAQNDRPIGKAILETAERCNVTQVVIGQPAHAKRWKRFWKDAPVRYLLRHMKYMDVRIVGWKEDHHSQRGEQVCGPKPLDPVKSRSTSLALPSMKGELRKGRLTIYVGAAPGVGKTYKMLRDAHDWRRRGKDVVIGLIETHGRVETAAQIEDLEVLPKRLHRFQGRLYEDLDVDAILQRKPEIVIIDELAHSNVPGSIREKRYQDIEYLLDHGIHVVTAVNIQHLESLHDKVEHITGVKVRERVPDWFMKLAREVKLIDVTPETLQQRLIDGKIYSEDKIQHALDHFFQIGNLSALRELALLEVADDVDQRLDRELDKGQSDSARQERILVAVNHRPHSEKLIRRGWRLADRLQAQLWVLVVLTQESLSEEDQRDLLRIQKLSQQFEATFITRRALEQGVGATIVAVAGELGISQFVTGQPLPSTQWLRRLQGNPIDYVLAHADFVDLYIVANSRE
ncbi:histidine kinase [Sulfoacidibacillus thermotolerans]|uniref:Histidine kinase n=2 Tax=Sulfoacidibacillus thermotolerans TaxID=1765684 RepID=A0A2U3D8J0_SULT2|nr:histidine kinase [Sulfoacidibacillus thermotolerans]